MKKIVYISGAITNEPDLNHFHDAERYLKEKGFIVINPARNPEGLSYESYMDISFAQVRASDIICVLPHSHKSLGSNAEVAYAKSIKKEIRFLRDEFGI